MDKLEEFSLNGQKNTEGLTLLSGFPSNLKPARQWFNWLFNSLTKKINEIIEESHAAIGLVSICPFEDIPTSHLECDGKIYNISEYPKLAVKLGNKYGGDGVLTFGVPDYRAEFLRGWDHGKGIDLSRTLGSQQEDAIRNIEGSMRAGSTPDGNTQFIDLLEATGAFEVIEGNKAFTGDDAGGTGQAWGVSFDASKVVNTADENRPRNVSVIYVIRAK
ncbi:phage tail protein [Acinetobacter sp. RW6]|uniref:phage tail protein n=1 Tax=Acinetobacter sp. RW6 TaxID=3242680 RepID=UPI0035C0FEFD